MGVSSALFSLIVGRDERVPFYFIFLLYRKYFFVLLGGCLSSNTKAVVMTPMLLMGPFDDDFV